MHEVVVKMKFRTSDLNPEHYGHLGLSFPTAEDMVKSDIKDFSNGEMMLNEILGDTRPEIELVSVKEVKDA